jgi:hypothetical protein
MAQSNLATLNLTTADTTPVQQYGQAFLDPKTGNEYIYLPGVASNAVADACVFTKTAAGVYTVSRLTTSTKGRVVVTLVANTSTTGGSWYLLNGTGTVTSSGATSGGALYASATAGSVTSTSASNAGISGAHSTSATSSGTSSIQLYQAYFGGV